MDHKHHLGNRFQGVGTQDHREDDALQDTPAEGDVAGDLGDFAPPCFAFVLLQILQAGESCGEQLQDDRGINERQDPQGEHTQGGDATASEDVEEANQLAPLLNELLEGLAVNPRNGDVDAKPHQHQKAQGRENTIPEPFGLKQLRDDFAGAWGAPPTDKHDSRS